VKEIDSHRVRVLSGPAVRFFLGVIKMPEHVSAGIGPCVSFPDTLSRKVFLCLLELQVLAASISCGAALGSHNTWGCARVSLDFIKVGGLKV
jgi:hypothetical protein